jgi:hypothetical protein
MIRSYRDKFPKIGAGVFIDESAQVIGMSRSELTRAFGLTVWFAAMSITFESVKTATSKTYAVCMSRAIGTPRYWETT